jgi:hypothetical protein
MGKISSHYDVVAEFYYKAHNEQLLNEWKGRKIFHQGGFVYAERRAA